MKRLFFILTIACYWLGYSASQSNACESCLIGQLGRNRSAVESESEDQQWFFKYTFEQQDWDKKPAHDVHELHEDGHHVHDKIKKEFYHFEFGNHVAEHLTIALELPYIARHSLEVEDHDILGSQQTSQGLGDMQLLTDYHLWHGENALVSAVGGIKFPTGETNDANSAGTKMEPELQPGSGSYDYTLGGVFNWQEERVSLASNLVYVVKAPGTQEFEFGDLLSTSLLVDYLLNPNSEHWKMKAGVDINFQYEQKQKENGNTIEDSGGTTLFVGPAMSIQTSPRTALFGSFLYPVHQDLGGVHQKLDFVWTAGGQLKW